MLGLGLGLGLELGLGVRVSVFWEVELPSVISVGDFWFLFFVAS